MFFLTSQERHQAVRFWARDGRLAFAHAWESNYGHSGFGNVFSPAVATDKFLFTTHSVLAHTPHCPDPRAEINVQEMQNVVFEGAEAAVADIHLDRAPPAEVLERCRAEKLEPVACVALVDRLEGGREAIEAQGVPLDPLFTRKDFIP